MADAGGSTDVEVLTDLSITGKPAQFGRGVMQDVSDKLLGQFVACLENRFTGRRPGRRGRGGRPGDPEETAPPSGGPEGPDAATGDAARSGRGTPATPAPAAAAAPAGAVTRLDLGATVLPVLVRSLLEAGAGGGRRHRAAGLDTSPRLSAYRPVRE